MSISTKKEQVLLSMALKSMNISTKRERYFFLTMACSTMKQYFDMTTAGSTQLCKDIATMETGRCSGFLIKTGELGLILLVGKIIEVRGGFQLSFLCD